MSEVTPVVVERGPRGRFGPGNQFGRKKTVLNGRARRLQAELLKSVSKADIRRLGQALIEKAMAGDVGAAALILRYTIPSPNTPAPEAPAERPATNFLSMLEPAEIALLQDLRRRVQERAAADRKAEP